MGNRAFQAPRSAALLILPLLAGLVVLWIHIAPPVNKSGELPLRMELPAELGPYGSQLLLCCQSDQCRQSFPVAHESDLKACPVCGGALALIALSEREILPADTRIARRVYHAPGSPSYTVSIVLAGADPRSIHRPQQCLPAQGFSIDREYTQTLSLTPAHKLTLAVIDTRRGAGSLDRFGYAYWFVGPDRETHSHYVRLFWTTYDHLFRNTVARWAYVSITASELLNTPESLERLAAFLRLLVPAIEIHPPVPS
jgi:hypothetical protein